MKFTFLFLLSLLLSFTAALDNNNPAPLSDESQECVDCHMDVTPGIVLDWNHSRHAQVTPGMALEKPAIKRRMSSPSAPPGWNDTAVGCYECHSLNAEMHADNFEHFGYDINVIVTPGDCSSCHMIEVAEYAQSKKGYAYSNLNDNSVYNLLVETSLSTMKFEDGKLSPYNDTSHTRGETCFACHGTKIEVTGMETIETEDYGEIEVPVLTNWPNQGVGRINPDGGAGACTSCHPRHSFSIKMARKPETCAECHLEPDVPAYNVYKESKHGNIYSSLSSDWDFDAVPWVVGEDFRAPTCAVCHASLVTTPDGDIVASRSHNFGSRIWTRIFGLIYSHPHPKSGHTTDIVNADGLPLPTTFAGLPAADFLIDESEQANRKDNMRTICKTCHNTQWVNGHFAQMDIANKEADAMVAAATNILSLAWEKGIADNTHPFDEELEQMWVRQWLFYANSVRYAGAMGGQDYATFKNGWYQMNENLVKMMEALEED